MKFDRKVDEIIRTHGELSDMKKKNGKLYLETKRGKAIKG